MEPQWTKQISSGTVCNTYYFIFVLYAFIAFVSIVGTIIFVFGGKLGKATFPIIFQGVLTGLLAAILALFQYIVCARSLTDNSK